MNDVAIGIVALLILMLVFLTGIELSFGMALIGLIGYTYLTSFSAACNLLVKDFFDTFTSYSLTVIPLFVLMGQIAYNSGTASRLYQTAHKFVGHVPGGLAITTVIGATLFKAMCGSTIATVATFSSIAIPQMQNYGYSKKLSTGIVASVGTLGVIFPPSIVLIIYGIITEQSIGELFLAGFLPGLLISLFFSLIAYTWARINPAIAPRAEASSWPERIRSLPELLWVVIIFGIVIGGMMFGFFTPTEAGTVGTLAVLVLAVIRERFALSKLKKSIGESLRIGCMVLMLLAGSAVLGHFLTITEIPLIAADWTASLPFDRNLIMVVIMLIYLLGGSFIDDIAFMMIATPIFYPVIIKLGYDPIWFGIMVGITLMVGAIIPPVAMCVFVVKQISGESFKVVYSGVLPFLIGLFVCAALLFLFPQIATFLPSLLMR